MKKLLCLLLVLSISTTIYAQKALWYSKGFIVAKVYEESTLVDSMPMGKDVTIVYDSFFKNYKIGYTNIDRDRIVYEFDLLSAKDGIIVVKDKISEDPFLVINDLDLSGEIIFIHFGTTQTAWLQIYGMQKE